MITVIKLNKIDKNATPPSKAYIGDACHDVVATSINITDSYIEYGLGFSSEIPEHLKGVIVPRSSISKCDLIMCNSPAQIDSGYKGEWKVRFKVTKELNYLAYEVGDRVAQIYFEPVKEVHLNLEGNNGEVESSVPKERGHGGFGSSGS